PFYIWRSVPHHLHLHQWQRLSHEDKSVFDARRCLMDDEDDKEKENLLFVDFYSGAHFLQSVAAWAYAVANQYTILEEGVAFEKAYAQLIGLHAAGKLGAGAADMSAEN